ncbi:MAG: hypothetical protein PHR14_08100 [Oscillospiraceae bacterium]|nr:hypothetical protein [Oscillospiraceae bacterium]
MRTKIFVRSLLVLFAVFALAIAIFPDYVGAVAGGSLPMPDQSNAIPPAISQKISRGYSNMANTILQRRRNKITQAQRQAAALRLQALKNAQNGQNK